MDWLAIQSFLRNWFIEVTGLPADNVGWADQNRERPKYPYATLNLLVDSTRGDELTYEFDPDNNALVEHLEALCEFTVTLKVECLSQHPSQNARFYLTKARSALSHTTGTEAFSTAGLAVINVLDLRQMDVVRALGMTSVGVMDLRLATMIDDFDAEKPTSYVQKAELTGTVDVPPEITIGPDMYGDTD